MHVIGDGSQPLVADPFAVASRHRLVGMAHDQVDGREIPRLVGHRAEAVPQRVEPAAFAVEFRWRLGSVLLGLGLRGCVDRFQELPELGAYWVCRGVLVPALTVLRHEHQICVLFILRIWSLFDSFPDRLDGLRPERTTTFDPGLRPRKVSTSGSPGPRTLMVRAPQSVLPSPALMASSTIARICTSAASRIRRIAAASNMRTPFLIRSLRNTFLDGRLNVGPYRTGLSTRPAS